LESSGKIGCGTWIVGLVGAIQLWIGVVGAATHKEVLFEKYDPKWAGVNAVIGTVLLSLAVSFFVKNFNPNKSDK
jgi:hypothetical protein